MDLNIYWSPGSNANIADGFNVFYKEYDPLGLNTWILANPTLLPYTATSYTITGLDANTVYRVMVAKSCLGIQDVVIESTVVNSGCPVVATWQGPLVNNYPTLFYSVYYPDGHHMGNARVAVYDTEVNDALPTSCPTPADLVVGRTAYITANFCLNFTSLYCAEQQLDFLSPSNASSAVSYLGRDTRNVFPGNSLLGTCDNGLPTVGGALAPLLLKYNNDYKFNITPQIKYASEFFYQDTTCFWYAVDVTPFSFPTNPAATYPTLNVANAANISAAICFDSVTGNVDYTLADGLGRTNINDYTFSFTTSDGVTTLPLVNSSGVPVTSYNGTYNIYAPIKIETFAPGGGNPAGYTIVDATSSGGFTTYTYTGTTNAFTVGQEVFVSNVNPSTYNFSTASKTITAATSNSFTVSLTAAGTYQTGGTASGYTELTDNMNITVDLQPGSVNVITLTNQNYSGLTLKQALDNIANSINTTTSYTASAVVIAGLPYLRIDVPGTGYTSASVIFEGPNILTKGAPDIYQTSSVGTLGSTNSSFSYNGFLYASFVESTAKIVASDISNPTVATDYNHPIDITVSEIVLVPEVPPATVYSLDHVTSGGDYSLNIAIDSSTGYSYIADNTTVSVYDGTTLIDSQDLSALPGGPTTPIRLVEFNSTDNRIYVFVDGASSNFYIVDVAPWGIINSGTYSQTNYLERNAITAWNNLTTGSTAAEGTVTGSPTVPIPLGTIPNPPNIYQPDSARFQDSTKTWNTPPPGVVSYAANNYKIYNSTQNVLGEMFFYNNSGYFIYPGISGDTISIQRGVDSTRPIPNTVPFTVSTGDSYGIFHAYNIVDYTASFTSRVWENTSRYLIESGRNAGANGFLNAVPGAYTTTVFPIDSYARYFNSPLADKMISSATGLDSTSNYLLYEINDGGTCYESTSNLVYVSLGNGTVETIDSGGTVTSITLYKDFPFNTVPVQGPLQLVADNVAGFVYGIARDARSSINDMNVYILQNSTQYGVVDGSSKWNAPVCGQIAVDDTTGILYFTEKNTRNFIILQDPTVTQTWSTQTVPSVYEKLNGFTYGDSSIIERIQGASYIGNSKFVIMNYLKQTYSTELKYTYDVANLFVYDFATNTVDQVLTGTGVNTYSGTVSSYNPNRYGEFFGFNDYNNDYCYGGLAIKTNPSNGQIFWKKSISDQVYFSESHAETGVAQLWGNSTGGGLIRIWNIQSDGSLVPSKRTIYDYYSSTFYNFIYDSYYEKLITVPSGNGYQFYLINTKTLGGLHGVNTIGTNIKNQGSFVNGLTPSVANQGKTCTVYGVAVSPTDITYNVRPSGVSAIYNGVFPHHFAVGDIVNVTGVNSVPLGELNFPNTDVSSAVIIAVSPTTFTVANIAGTSATYISGGTVQLANYANMNTTMSIQSDNAGNIYCYALVAYSGASGPYYPQYSSLILKYGPSDILTQRETPDYVDIGVVSTVCSSTPDGLFYNSNFTYPTKEFGFIKVSNQNTYWLIGNKNPTCTITNITNAVYDSLNQTIRYYITNSFSVGKVVNINGVLPTTYNLNRVTITAADPAWFEISYTGAAPAAFDPLTPATSNVGLSSSYVIKVLDDTTFATVATIDLSFINDYLDTFGNAYSSIQYSPSTDEIYLYYQTSTMPVYVFSTVTNGLVRSSSFGRMVLPYTNLNHVYTLEDVNGVPYFSAATNADTPSRRWFRLDLGNRSYLDNVHNELNVSITDYSTSTTVDNYDLYSLSNMSDTFGQWKEITDTTWATIPSTISTTLGATIEFTSFILDKPLVAIRNLTQGTTYSISNGLNAIKVYTILVDSINLFNGDLLEFEFTNPDNPSCPFINQSTITF